MKKTAYYAHNRLTYGTKREKSEMKWLRKHFDVLDPNTGMGELGATMPYLKAVSKCKLVVCSEVDGHLSRGTFTEVKFALAHKKPAKVLRRAPKGYILLDVTKVVVTDVTDKKLRYGKVVARMFVRR